MQVTNYIHSKTSYAYDCEMLECVWQNAVREHGVVGELLLEILPTFLNVWLFNSADGLDTLQQLLSDNWLEWEDLRQIITYANECVMQLMGVDELVVYRGVDCNAVGTNDSVKVRRLSSWTTNQEKAVHFAIQGNVYCTKLRANQMFLMWQCNSLLRETLNEYECILWTEFDDSFVSATVVQSTVTREDV